MKNYRDIQDNLDSMRINNTDQNYEKMARRASKSLADYEISTISSSRDIGKLFGAGSGDISREFKKSVDSVEKALNELSKVFEKSSKDAASFEQKKEAVQKAILELDKQDIARRRRQAQFEGRVGTVKGWTGALGAIGEAAGAYADFQLNRQTQRRESIKYMNDIYIGGERALASFDYMGMKKYGAYMSKEAIDFGKHVAPWRMVGGIAKGLASTAENTAITAMAGSLMGTPILGGIAAAGTAISGLFGTMNSGVFDAAKYARQARTEKAETIIEANRIQWELRDTPKFEANVELYRSEQLMGRRGLLSMAKDEKRYQDLIVEDNEKKMTRIVDNQRSGRESELRLIKDTIRGREIDEIERTSGSPMYGRVWTPQRPKEALRFSKMSNEDLKNRAAELEYELLERGDSGMSKLLQDFGWMFGGNATEVARALSAGSAFFGKSARTMGRSSIAAHSRGLVASSAQYSQFAGTIAPFSSDVERSLNQILNQFAGKTPEMNQMVMQYISRLSEYSSSRGVDIGANAGILLRSAMNKAGKDWTMQDVQKAASAISSVDEKLTNGQLDMGKVMASGTLSRLGIDGMAQARLFQLDSSQIATLQRASEKGKAAFDEEAKKFGIYGVSHQQWKEGGISSALVGGSYTTAALFMGASGNVQALLGMRGNVDAKEAEAIFDSMSDREKNTFLQITGQMGAADAIRSTVTGDISKDSNLSKFMSGASGVDKAADKLRQDMQKLNVSVSSMSAQKWKEASMDEMMVALAMDYNTLSPEARQKYLLAAKEAADKTFGIVNVNVMTVTSFNKK